MPIYEYRCNRCQKLESVFLRSFSEQAQPVCARCGGTDFRKLVSRFYSPRSDDERADAMTDETAFSDLDESDPRSIARWAKRLAAETGEDMGDEFREMVDMMEAGQLPDDDAVGDEGEDSQFGSQFGSDAADDFGGLDLAEPPADMGQFEPSPDQAGDW